MLQDASALLGTKEMIRSCAAKSGRDLLWSGGDLGDWLC